MSDIHDRDASTDKLLRQALSADWTEPSEACLDAETAAAWFDGGLGTAERERTEAHLADCARCQALVGAVARTATVTSDAPAEAPSRRWLGWFVPVAAGAVIVVAVLVVPDREPIDRIDQAATAPAAEQEGARQRLAEADAAPPALEERLDIARGNQAAAPPVAAEPPARPSTPAAAGQAVGRMQQQRAETAATEELMADVAGFDVLSPTPATRWRVHGPRVERTIDDGTTWIGAQPEFEVAPVAGSAPSAATCWLVGPAGVVFLTTDGLTWRRVAFPEAVDLATVTATDARTATVTAADGRVFGTTDGGATWVLRPPVQET